MHFQPETLAACFAFWGANEEFLAFSTIEFLFAFFMALKCYFQQLLSYKYLLFFFSSFPPGEKGRGPIENSALSLSVGFKYRSNNRSLLLFFFKFPVVLLAGSAAERHREGEGSSLYADLSPAVSVYVCTCRRVVCDGGVGGAEHVRVNLRVHGCVPPCTRQETLMPVQTLTQNLRRQEMGNHQREEVKGTRGHR